MSSFEILRTIVATQFRVHPDAIRETTVIAALPGAEPKARTALLIRLEDWFQVSLSDQTLCDALSLGDLAQAIDEKSGTTMQAAE